MIDAMKNALAANDSSMLGDEMPFKLQVAAAALLVYAAKADGSFSEDELDRVMRSLAREFKKPDHDSAEMIEVAEYLHCEKKRIGDFIQMLNASLADDQKQHLVQLVTRVIKSDGRVSVAEKILGGEIAKGLGVS